ncbi:MAG TPA: aminoglycoside phosphotransferase [Streptosporangiaceae bacterium]|jgi:hypothetical protein
MTAPVLRPPRVPDGEDLPADWLRFLHSLLQDARRRLRLDDVTGTVTGPAGGSIGGRACRDGIDLWLRVAPFYADQMDRQTWTGNADANQLTGIARPRVINRIEWPHPPIEIGADLMTYIPDPPCAPHHDLTGPLAVSETWWTSLRTSLDRLAAHPGRRDLDPLTAAYGKRVTASFGPLPPAITPSFSVQHGDLHWSNLTAPSLHILDWEVWGRTIDGLGPASLYCSALLVPDTAAKVHAVFRDILDSPSGRYAQLCIITDRINYHDPSYDSQTGTRLRHLARTILSRTD